jgi:hypothetical protein
MDNDHDHVAGTAFDISGTILLYLEEFGVRERWEEFGERVVVRYACHTERSDGQEEMGVLRAVEEDTVLHVQM